MNRFIIQIIMILFGVVFLITAFQIRSMGFKGDVLNQKDYVILLSWLLIIASSVSIIAEYMRMRKHPKQEQSEQDAKQAESMAEAVHEYAQDKTQPESGKKQQIQNKHKVYISMVLLVLFAYGFTYIGFFVTSFVYVFILTWMIYDWSRTKWLKSLLFSAGLNIVLYFLFDIIHVYFPKTLLF